MAVPVLFYLLPSSGLCTHDIILRMSLVYDLSYAQVLYLSDTVHLWAVSHTSALCLGLVRVASVVPLGSAPVVAPFLGGLLICCAEVIASVMAF